MTENINKEPTQNEKSGSRAGGSSPSRKSPLKKYLRITVILAILAVAVAAAILLLSRSDSKPSYLLYIKDNKLMYSNLSGSKSFEVSGSLSNEDLPDDFAENYAGACKVSENGKIIFYPDNFGGEGLSFYYRPLNNFRKKAEILDSDILDYSISDDGKKLAYVKGEGRELYLANADTKEKIDENVSLFFLGGDGKALIYQTEDGKIYLKEPSKSKAEIDDGSLEYASRDLSVFYYIKNNALYKKERDKDSVQIGGKATGLIKAYDTGGIFFYSESTAEVMLSEYIDDDLQQSDLALTAPEYPIIPSRTDYDTQELYDSAMEGYELAEKEYEEITAEYAAKEERDAIRAYVSETSTKETKTTLYFYDGSEAVELADNFDLESFEHALDRPVIAYYSLSQTEEGGKVKMSDIKNAIELESKIDEARKSQLLPYFAIGRNSSQIMFKDALNLRISPSGNALYFLSEVTDEKKYGDLYKIEILGNLAQPPEKYDTGVSLGLVFALNDGSALYCKNTQEYIADIYLNQSRLGQNIYWPKISFDNEMKNFSFISNWSIDNNYGSLNAHIDGHQHSVANRVGDSFWTNSGELAYLQDYNSSSGNLFLHREDKEPLKIDEGVFAILK